jgi:hypothetical protein
MKSIAVVVPYTENEDTSKVDAFGHEVNNIRQD